MLKEEPMSLNMILGVAFVGMLFLCVDVLRANRKHW